MTTSLRKTVILARRRLGASALLLSRFAHRALGSLAGRARLPAPGCHEKGPHDFANDSRRVEALRDLIQRGLLCFDDAVIELADADCYAGLASLAAPRLGLCPEIVFRALSTGSDETVMLLCRAAVLGTNAYSAVLRMRCRRDGLQTSPADALAAYRRTPHEQAEPMLRDLEARRGPAESVMSARTGTETRPDVPGGK
jgi:hypothetical protein